jgi:hypothetical protein
MLLRFRIRGSLSTSIVERYCKSDGDGIIVGVKNSNNTVSTRTWNRHAYENGIRIIIGSCDGFHFDQLR